MNSNRTRYPLVTIPFRYLSLSHSLMNPVPVLLVCLSLAQMALKLTKARVLDESEKTESLHVLIRKTTARPTAYEGVEALQYLVGIEGMTHAKGILKLLSHLLRTCRCCPL